MLAPAAWASFSQADFALARLAPFTSTHLRQLVAPAQLWEPRLAPLHPGQGRELPEQLRPYHEQLYALLTALEAQLPGLQARLTQGTGQIQLGLQTNNSAQVAQGVEQLIGLGPGLTPLGDDLLVGMLGGLYWAALPVFRAEMVTAFRAGIKSKRTTQLSRLWLDHAVQGEFGEEWHQLGAALADGDEQQLPALERMAARGATSGLAALSGLYQSWPYLTQAR